MCNVGRCDWEFKLWVVSLQWAVRSARWQRTAASPGIVPSTSAWAAASPEHTRRLWRPWPPWRSQRTSPRRQRVASPSRATRCRVQDFCIDLVSSQAMLKYSICMWLLPNVPVHSCFYSLPFSSLTDGGSRHKGEEPHRVPLQHLLLSQDLTAGRWRPRFSVHPGLELFLFICASCYKK